MITKMIIFILKYNNILKLKNTNIIRGYRLHDNLYFISRRKNAEEIVRIRRHDDSRKTPSDKPLSAPEQKLTRPRDTQLLGPGTPQEAQLNKQDESGALMAARSYPVLRAAVQPGDHTVQVKLSYRGEKGGLFSYMAAFHADVKSSDTFVATEGKLVRVHIAAREVGGFFSPLEKRLGLVFDAKTEALQGAATPKADGATP